MGAFYPKHFMNSTNFVGRLRDAATVSMKSPVVTPPQPSLAPRAAYHVHRPVGPTMDGSERHHKPPRNGILGPPIMCITRHTFEAVHTRAWRPVRLKVGGAVIALGHHVSRVRCPSLPRPQFGQVHLTQPFPRPGFPRHFHVLAGKSVGICKIDYYE